MLSWEGVFNSYTVKPSDRLKKVTQPLKDHLGISCFFYIRITSGGDLVWLGNRPDCAEYYIENRHFMNDPCMRHPRFWESGYSLLGDIASDAYQKTFLKRSESLFKLNSWIVLSNRGKEFVELSGFAGEDITLLKKIYLNHNRLLRSFSSYFKKEMGSVIRQMAEESISLVELIGDGYQSAPMTIQPKISAEIDEKFLKDCGMQLKLQKTALLSERERQCLVAFLSGKCAKETAKELNLSPRTIESYFENIKNKLSCENKNEIFRFCKELDELGLINTDD